MRSIILAFALTGAWTVRLYAPPVPPTRIAADAAIAWANRYRTDPALAGKIIRAANRHGLDRDVAFRLVRRESSFRVTVRGDAGEIGLTQIKPSTAQDLRPGVTVSQLYDPDVNLDLGFAYVARLRSRYHGDMWRAATAYNRGMAVADTLQGASEYAIALLGRLPRTGSTRPGPGPRHPAD